MSVRNKTYKVTSLSKVNTTLYKNGDLFYTGRAIGVLHNGKIKTIGNDKQDLSDYVTKDELPDLTGYAKKDELPDLTGYVKRDEVQQMIDEAISNLGGDGNE